MEDGSWLGKEMLRQVEVRLAAQATALAALEARASSMLNLCGAGVLALGAAAFTARTPELVFAASVAAVLLLAAGGVLLAVLMPARDWGVAGVEPQHMTEYRECEEADCLEVMASALGQSVAPNSARLKRFNWGLRIAAAMILLAAPIGAAIAHWAVVCSLFF